MHKIAKCLSLLTLIAKIDFAGKSEYPVLTELQTQLEHLTDWNKLLHFPDSKHSKTPIKKQLSLLSIEDTFSQPRINCVHRSVVAHLSKLLLPSVVNVIKLFSFVTDRVAK